MKKIPFNFWNFLVEWKYLVIANIGFIWIILLGIYYIIIVKYIPWLDTSRVLYQYKSEMDLISGSTLFFKAQCFSNINVQTVTLSLMQMATICIIYYIKFIKFIKLYIDETCRVNIHPIKIYTESKVS